MKHRSFKPQFRSYWIALCALYCAANFLLFVPVATAQDSEISSLSTELFTLIRKSKPLSDGSRTAVVIDFSGPGADVSELGLWLADQISMDLSRTPRGFQMMDRKKFRDALEEQKIPSSVLQQDGPASCSARSAGASVFILGSLTTQDDAVELSVKVVQTSDRKKIGERKQRIPLTPDLKALAGRTLPLPTIPSLLEYKPNEPNFPLCAYCPVAQFSELARRARFSGTVVLSLTVTEDGHVEDISVARGAPCGLTEMAIQAVKRWRFRPATKPDGTPVAVRTAVEVVFRLL